MRIDYSPSYRVYFAQRGRTLFLLLNGGDKHMQKRDIQTAIALAHEV
jgi:putative addiction module killer protein